ncbi:MAG: efflux RND transporter permease subunit [Hyphomicrobiaceae bacterium]
MIAVAAGLIFLGFKQLREMSIDVFPEFAPPMVEIQTPSIGLSAQEVEELVSIPSEEALAGLPGLANLRSKSVPERIAQVTPSPPISQFPPMMLPPLSATSRVMKIGISSKKHSVIDLSMITYWKIRQRLLRIPGVAKIAIWGERLKMYHVEVDPKRLQANGVALNKVMKMTADEIDSAKVFRWRLGQPFDACPCVSSIRSVY